MHGYIFGKDIKPQKINRTIEVTDIAPSVAYRLRIRSPNASVGEILEELFKVIILTYR